MIDPLVSAALAAANNAHAPYSEFHVGAAVLTEAGAVFPGCNVENASFGLTICAERAAVCAAVTAGQPRIKAVVVVAPGAPALTVRATDTEGNAFEQVLPKAAEG